MQSNLISNSPDKTLLPPPGCKLMQAKCYFLVTNCSPDSRAKGFKHWSQRECLCKPFILLYHWDVVA